MHGETDQATLRKWRVHREQATQSSSQPGLPPQLFSKTPASRHVTKAHLCPYGLKQSMGDKWNGLPSSQNCHCSHAGTSRDCRRPRRQSTCLVLAHRFFHRKSRQSTALQTIARVEHKRLMWTEGNRVTQFLLLGAFVSKSKITKKQTPAHGPATFPAQGRRAPPSGGGQALRRAAPPACFFSLVYFNSNMYHFPKYSLLAV